MLWLLQGLPTFKTLLFTLSARFSSFPDSSSWAVSKRASTLVTVSVENWLVSDSRPCRLQGGVKVASIIIFICIYTQFSTYSIIQMQKKYGGDGDDDDEEEEDVSIMYIYPEPWPREDVLLLCKCLGGFSVTRVWCSLQRFWVVMDSGIGLLVLSLWFWARVSNVFSRDQWLRPFSRRFFLDFPL